jgi:hypothetical protein
MKCSICQFDFPSKLFRPLEVNEETFDDVCPLCAGEICAHMHGFELRWPNNPFEGPSARRYWDDAKLANPDWSSDAVRVKLGPEKPNPKYLMRKVLDDNRVKALDRAARRRLARGRK